MNHKRYKETAENKSYKDDTATILVPIFTIEWLVVAKYLADHEEAKDALDIWALYQRGSFDIKNIVKKLRLMGMREEAKDFPEFIGRLKNLKRRAK